MILPIDPTSGVIEIVSELNHEIQSVYMFVLFATDGGNKTGNVSVTVNIIDANDNTPYFDPPAYSKSIPEV